jgi:4-amino-4-deoxy-L-arabinose transferase-like glycosyltransferase
MNFELPAWCKPAIVLLVVACAFAFAGLNSFDLRESTEPREAGIAAGMLQDHQYLVPTLNGRPFLEKPPLSYWLQAAAIDAFGYSPAAPRLPSALAGVCTVLLLVCFFRKSEDRKWLTLLAGLFLITMLDFWRAARTAGQDEMLAFGISLALFFFYSAKEEKSTISWLLYSAGIAVATMTKGVIGLAVPGVVIGANLVLETVFIDKRIDYPTWGKAAFFGLVGLLPLSAWLLALFNEQGMPALREVLWANTVERFQGDYAAGSHVEPFYFYFKKLAVTYQPWSILVYAAIWLFVKDAFRNRRLLFLLCWMIVPYALLSLSAGKRLTYLLMLYPAAAALAAHFVVHYMRLWSSGTEQSRARLFKVLGLIYTGALVAAALYLVVYLFRLGERPAAAVVALLSVVAFGALWQGYRQRRLLPTLAGGLVILFVTYVSYFSFVTPQLDFDSSARRVMDTLSQLAGDKRPIALYQPMERMEGAATYYLRRHAAVIDSEARLRETLLDRPDTVVLISESSKIDLSRFRDEARIRYGKDNYHYISGPSEQK